MHMLYIPKNVCLPNYKDNGIKTTINCTNGSERFIVLCTLIETAPLKKAEHWFSRPIIT